MKNYIKITRLSDALGAEINGVDITSIEGSDFDAISAAFWEHQVLVFRDQSLQPQAQIDFSKRFGQIETRPDRPSTLDGLPEVSVLSNRNLDGEPVGIISAGDFWHSDLSFADAPARATFLHALEVAEEGGDTEWANMYLAYETLSDQLKHRIERLRGIHVFDRRKNRRARVDMQFEGNAEKIYGLAIPDAVHPLVRMHPDTGRRSLYVSPRFVVGVEGMNESEAQPLLEQLFEHQVRPEFRYRHKWRKGDFLMWDNASLIHVGLGGIKPPGIRHMHRTMVLGEQPV